MLSFLKDCIHIPTDLDKKSLDSVYFKELEIIIKADLAKVKKGEKFISEFKETIVKEISHVCTIINSPTYDEYFGIYFTFPDHPAYHHIPDDDALITLLRKYSSFLIKTRYDIRSIIDDPEYWKMRESLKGENTDSEQIYTAKKNNVEHIEATIFDSPEKAQENVKHILGILLHMGKITEVPEKIVKIKDKERKLAAEYWLTSTVKDVQQTLEELVEKGQINIEDIPAFMKNNLLSKKGKKLAASFRTEKSVKKRKNL